MKKLLLVSFTLFLVSTAMAQEFAFGPRAGISLTKIDLKNNDMFIPGDAEVGYHFGVFARLSAASFYLQPEVLYTQTSGVVNTPIPGSNGDFDLEFNRLDVPVMAGIKVLRVLRVQAGPIFSYDLGSKIKDSSGATLPGVDYEKFSVAYQAGLGVDIGNLYLDAKYEGSLGGVLENIGGFDTDERLSQFVFSLGFKLF